MTEVSKRKIKAIKSGIYAILKTIILGVLLAFVDESDTLYIVFPFFFYIPFLVCYKDLKVIRDSRKGFLQIFIVFFLDLNMSLTSEIVKEKLGMFTLSHFQTHNYVLMFLLYLFIILYFYVLRDKHIETNFNVKEYQEQLKREKYENSMKKEKQRKKKTRRK